MVKKLARLAGVPFIAKDNFWFGADTTAGNVLKGFSAPYRATAVERLEPGAICIARLTSMLLRTDQYRTVIFTT